MQKHLAMFCMLRSFIEHDMWADNYSSISAGIIGVLAMCTIVAFANVFIQIRDSSIEKNTIVKFE